MSYFPDAAFLTSANAPEQFVEDRGAEVAFAGRSNAGKSSAINAIVNRRAFARTSKTPGRTRLVNFFALSPGRRLVDLPGYGFARVAETTREHWGGLLSDYFRTRRSLKGLILVIDSRRGLTDHDRQLLALAAALPVHVLLSKADKLKPAQAAAGLVSVRRSLGERASVQLFSVPKREGQDQARSALERLLSVAQ